MRHLSLISLVLLLTIPGWSQKAPLALTLTHQNDELLVRLKNTGSETLQLDRITCSGPLGGVDLVFRLKSGDGEEEKRVSGICLRYVHRGHRPLSLPGGQVLDYKMPLSGFDPSLFIMNARGNNRNVEVQALVRTPEGQLGSNSVTLKPSDFSGPIFR